MEKKYKVVLAIDCGGTYYKTALVSLAGELHEGTFKQLPSCSTGTKEEVLNQLKNVLELMKQIALEKDLEICRISLGFPGPFDYIACCTLMVHKFISIKNVPLKPIINEIIPCKEIHFHYDLHGSTKGAYLFDEAKGFSKVYCIGIGTGLGTGYLKDSNIVSHNHGQPRYPIFQMKLGDNVLEDFVSNRAIVNGYINRTSYTGELDAKIVEDFASSGDENAIAVYQSMGEILGKSIRKILTELEIECVVFCGQISKGFKYFGPSFEKAVADIPYLKKIAPVKDFDSLALRGLCFLDEEK